MLSFTNINRKLYDIKTHEGFMFVKEYQTEISNWAYLYCKWVEDLPEIRNLITTEWHVYCYLTTIENRDSDSDRMRTRMTSSEFTRYYNGFLDAKIQRRL